MPGSVSVVATHCGLVTSLGAGVETNWRRRLAGVSGRGPVARFDAARYHTRWVHPVADLPAAPLPAAAPLDCASQMLLAAMQEAIGGRSAAYADAPCYVATTLGGMQNGTVFFRDYLAHGITVANRAGLKDYLPFMQGRHVQAAFGLRRLPLVVTNACASGANALGLAYLAVQSGRARAAIAAGFDVISEFVFGGFYALRLMAQDHCRPFDVARDGLVLGEGAGVIVLEEEQAARAAGRPVLAAVRGYASHAEAYHVTKPHPAGAGALQVMRNALRAAGLQPADVQFVSAHATGTRQNDLMEAHAIRTLWGSSPGLAVTAHKSAIGHTLGASGLIEAIFSMLSLRDQVIPPTLHTREVIPELPAGALVQGGPRPMVLRHALSAAFGFGGSNAAVVLAHPEERQ